MAEERRKRQQEREESFSGAEGRKFLTYGFVILLLVSAFLGGRYYRKVRAEQLRKAEEEAQASHKYDSFAKCLAAKQAKMYGLFWCPHCADQKAEFGASFEYVPYVECAIKGSREMASECKAAGVKLFPSWQFGSDPPKEGVLTLQALSEKTGCSLP